MKQGIEHLFFGYTLCVKKRVPELLHLPKTDSSHYVTTSDNNTLSANIYDNTSNSDSIKEKRPKPILG
ncbi:15259_t:CDS:2 [Acaulospora morrowiae]|uniref:15259_t:CDS:1 n=1 Tax=Acaulospora morrowiae TaxID=94023 RepID=A0A9N9FF98_9GLOM|nr:15259_t:CDS:2 [Acaulospora morrowiae]